MTHPENQNPVDTPTQKNGRKRALLGAGAAVAVLAGAATYAAFTSEASIGSEFTSGNIRLALNDQLGDNTFSPTPIDLAGATATYLPLKIENVGSLDGNLALTNIYVPLDKSPASTLNVGLSYLGTDPGACNQSTFDDGTVRVPTNIPLSNDTAWDDAFQDAADLDIETPHYYCYAFTANEQNIEINPTWEFTLTESD